MKISAATLIKNAIKFDYPIIESIKSLEPYVDEYVINLGDSEDETEKLVMDAFGSNPKFKIFKSVWEGKEQGMAFFRNQTNKALDQCTGDWIFYLQADECVHEDEMKNLRKLIEEADAAGKRAIALNFLHFEKNYSKIKKGYSEGFDAYEKEVRIIKNGCGIRSSGDAMGFCYTEEPYAGQMVFINGIWGFGGAGDTSPEAQVLYSISPLHMYHYGYVKSPRTMLEKKLYLKEFYFSDPAMTDELKIIENGKIRSVGDKYKYSRQLNNFEGTHPSSMKLRIKEFGENNPELLE